MDIGHTPPSKKHAGHHRDNQSGLKQNGLFFLPILLGLIILLQGGQLLWAQGLILTLIGGALFLMPPIKGLGPQFDKVMLGLLILPFLAFLPAAFLPCGDWRELAINSFHITIPRSLLIDYRLWSEHYINLLAVSGFFYWINQLTFSHGERRFLLTEWAWVAFFLALGLLIANANELTYRLVPDARVFTYFPSKNQTGTVLFLGGIISFGLMIENALKKRIGSLILYASLTIISLAAIIETHSRASFFLFIFGCGLILFFKIRPINFVLIAKISLPFLLGVGSLFLLLGGELDRVKQIFISGDFRFQLYWDSLALIKDHWLTGVGLGHFEWIIPFYRSGSQVAQRTLHPESDLLWWISELGIFSILIVFWLIWHLSQRIRPLFYDNQVSSRVIPLAALIAYGVHALCDVPMHFWGSLLPALFLYALCKKERPIPGLFPPIAFKLLGVFLASIGWIWIGADLFQKTWHTRIINKTHNETIEQLLKVKTANELPPAFNEAITSRPLDWWLYYSKGLFLLNLLNEPLEAKDNFNKALFLEPVSSIVPFWIGVAWLPYAPALTYDAWVLAADAASSDKKWLFEDMMRRSSGYKDFGPYLSKLSNKNNYFRGRYLETVSPAYFLKEFNETLKICPDLSIFTIDVRRKLYLRFAELDPESALVFLEKNKKNVPDAWYVEATALKKQKKWEMAAQKLVDNMPVPPGLTTPKNTNVKELERKFSYNSRDAWVGTDLLSLQVQKEDWPRVLETIDMLLLLDVIPSYLYYWQAVANFHMHFYEASCRSWDTYIASIAKVIEKDAEALRMAQDVAEVNKRLINQGVGVSKSKANQINF